ncbi:MAG: DUF4159 domain-containing protein [Gemmatimonadales bacterium]
MAVASKAVSLSVMLAVVLSGTARAQRWNGGSDYTTYNVEYDGRFTFVRLSFRPLSGQWGRWRPDLKWDHDWPIAESNLMKLLKELSYVNAYLEGSNILAADDPELFKYPVGYVSEPGYWTVSESEAHNLRNYLLKGGFLIFDDFAGRYEWANFLDKLRMVLPDAIPMRLDSSHPIFHSFFDIDSLNQMHPYRGVPSEYWGIFEGNDRSKRLMVIINYNNDVGDYWEWSDTGFLPIDFTNDSYKLGLNYVVYAMTH